MSTREKENKAIQDMLKNIFKKKQSCNFKGKSEYVVSNNILKDLSKESLLAVRIKALQDLNEIIMENKIEQKSIGNVWHLVKDMLSPDYPKETRDVAFSFLQCLIISQYDRLVNIIRAEFFRFIKTHSVEEDVIERFEVLQVLTNNGKDLQYFEEEVGPFLLKWAPDIDKTEKGEEFLQLIVNVIKFNAAYLDDETIIGFIHNVSGLMSTSKDVKKVTTCLNILNALVAYSNMPRTALPLFIAALCRAVNVREHCQSSWAVMKNLLGTHMGHASIYLMCHILCNAGLKDDEVLLRGVIFFVHNALWSSQSLSNLVCPPLSVLPSIYEGLKLNVPGITYEVMVAVNKVVIKYQKDLMNPTWQIIMNMISLIVDQMDKNADSLILQKAAQPLHNTLDTVEKLIDTNTYNGDLNHFYQVLEKCINIRSNESVFKLVDYMSLNITPYEDQWLTLLGDFLQKYLKTDIKSQIRLKVLENLTQIIRLNMSQFENELIDIAIFPFMLNLHEDPDVLFRANAVNFLIDLCIKCENNRCLEILNILEKVLVQPFVDTSSTKQTESDFYDIKCLIKGLIRAFTIKLYKTPHTFPLYIYEMLTHFLKSNYDYAHVFERYSEPRKMIFSYFLKMRADDKYRLGCPNKEGIIKYSPYIFIKYSEKDPGPLDSPPALQGTRGETGLSFLKPEWGTVEPYIPLRKVFYIFLVALRAEKDWSVINLILQELPKVLQNKNLILTKKQNNELHYFIDVISSLLSESPYMDAKVNKADYYASVMYLLVNMASYYNYVPQTAQSKMISCLMQSLLLLNRCLKFCIPALTICTLEMKDAMVKLLPKLLLNLSKISATVQIALPVLEFLSVLSQLPTVYGNFHSKQYMAVFAISLPYTNPFKYNNYIASLAHQVIHVWFLKCRLPLRKNFVKYITTGLQTNVLIPFEEEKALLRSEMKRLSEMNQNSSDRKRSSSLTEQGHPRRRAATVSSRVENKPKPYLQKPSINNTVFTFYKELTEVCVDLMARYAFLQSQEIVRGSLSDYLLKKGQHMTWVVGHTIVTITTSGCSEKVLKNGICETCWETVSNVKKESDVSRQNSNEKSDEASVSSPIEDSKRLGDHDKGASSSQEIDDDARYACPCWCMGWAEIHFRRPTGDMIFLIRISPEVYNFDVPLKELDSLYAPFINTECSVESSKEIEDASASGVENVSATFTGMPSEKQSPSRQSSRESMDDESDTVFDDGTTSRNPVRRSNSSPEMLAGWKNPFLRQKEVEEDSLSQDEDMARKNKPYVKDMRVSCEAIPEEIGLATTPPKVDQSATTAKSNIPPKTTDSTQQQQHPSLMSYYSYPGSSPPVTDSATAAAVSKPYHTVPPSPNATVPSNKTQPLFPPRSLPLKPVTRDSQDGTDRGAPRSSVPHNVTCAPPLVSKPPQSPTQTSPRLPAHSLREGHEIQKSSSSSLVEKTTAPAREKTREHRPIEGIERSVSVQDSQTLKRDRLHTVSVMGSSGGKPEASQQPRLKEGAKSGLNPSLVFIHMYHSAIYGFEGEGVLPISESDIAIQRSLKILDSIPAYQTYKFGVIYVGIGQSNNESEILRNTYGSMRFTCFLSTFGQIIKLPEADPHSTFLGGLERNGNDGRFTYVWSDDFIRIMFHVATLMPTRESDPKCTNKKKHIGNDSVVIVYNESGEEYDINTLKGQMNFASIIVEPLDHDTNRVTVKAKPDLLELIGDVTPMIVSEQSVAILVRQLALHYDLASHVLKSSKTNAKDPYSSNWLERLRKIKQIREKLVEEKEQQRKQGLEDPVYVGRLNNIDDATDYT